MSTRTMNDDRADWALAAVRSFAARTGLDGGPESDWLETAISDLLINLIHLCDRQGISFTDLLTSRILPYYQVERDDPEPSIKDNL